MKSEVIKELAREVRFECSEEEVKEIATAFEILENQLAFFEEINTEGVEEMIFPFDVETSFLREDVAENVRSREDILRNAAETLNGHVVVPKVVR